MQRLLLAAIPFLSVAVATGAIKIDPSKAALTCDNILRFAYPDLCDMKITRGQLLVRNLTLVYWHYRNKLGSSDKAPVLMVHGGPGFSHDYILPMKQQACRGREVVFYDQVGAGKSSQPADLSTAPWLLTVQYYNEEVNALAAHFRWKKFHFFGSSWGTIVGQSYGLTQDPRLLSIAFQGPLSDGQLYGKAQWDPKQGNIGSLPLHVQDLIRQLGDLKAFDSALYASEDQALTSFFTVRTTPVPDCFNAASPPSATAKQIYAEMQGPSEFAVGGILASMNFTPRLHEIKTPVLLTHGRYDTMRPPVVDAMYRSLPRAWRAQLPRSGHVSMIDEPRLLNDMVGDFYDHVEAGTLELYRVPREALDPGDLPLTVELVAAPSAEQQPAPAWLLVVASLLVGVALGGVLGAKIVMRVGGRSSDDLRYVNFSY